MTTLHPFAGKHPTTATITGILRNMDVVNPVTDAPFTEAMILGIGGGIGAGYILWEFKAHESATIVLGFRNRWNYTTEFLTNLLDRLSLPVTVYETGSRKKAAAALDETLAQGIPALVWVDKAHMPYLRLPEALKGYASHQIAVYEKLDDDRYRLDDLAEVFFTLTAEEMAAARDRIPSDKNRLLTLSAPSDTDLPASVRALVPSEHPAMDLPQAIRQGIEDCLQHLGRDSKSFALPVYRKWAKLMTNRKNKKGWHVVFAERKGLYTTLRSIYEGIKLDGTEGYGLRLMYADFLKEAAPVLSNPALEDAAQAYRIAAQAWDQFAQCALPDEIDSFKETKALMQERYRLHRTGNIDMLDAVMQKLADYETRIQADFPLNEPGVDTLFETMQDALMAIYDAENSALATLKQAMAQD